MSDQEDFGPVNRFVGQHAFLSNFYEASVWVDKQRYLTVEHAYQAAKTNDEQSKKLIREAKTAAIAKNLGKAVSLRPDWDDVKVEVMTTLVRQKFQSPFLRALLLKTGDRELIEGNYFNDKFWGFCLKKNIGENWLGKILMQVREELKKED